MERSQLNPTGAPETSGLDTNAAKAQEILHWLDPLLKDPNFQRFLAMMKDGAQQLHDEALDIEKPADERDRFAQRYFILQQWATWPEVQHASCIRILNETQRLLNAEREAQERNEQELQKRREQSSYFDSQPQMP